MPTYRYQNGDRPLEGFSIEHGVGRGGFGEVYYAISDSGRQVALKAVQNYEDIELRGIRHCMNLKSPHLVTIFDVKNNDEGVPFVIMEYVSGPSLRQLLDEAPNGLGVAKSAYFLRELAKGLTYLHDCGIVHRDMKPHNVFYEEGYVKIGDYSLSKVIDSSHRSGHTLTVGTVHYMAPEISMGRYDHTVDIYALGAVLYEMLTGEPPFVGESVGEVLMKHMTADVDVSKVDEPFASAIKKALAKEPADRYQSAQELVEDVFGAEHIQDSVTAFNPNSLSLVAERVADKVPISADAIPAKPVEATRAFRSGGAESDRVSREKKGTDGAQNAQRPKSFSYHAGQAASQLLSSVALFSQQIANGNPRYDPFDHRYRVTLAVVTVFVMSVAVMVLGGDEDFWGLAFIAMVANLIGLRVVWKWFPRFHDSALTTRLVTGGVAIGMTALTSFIAVEMFRVRGPRVEEIFGIVAPMFILDLRGLAVPVRPNRICLLPTLFAAFLAAIASPMLDGNNPAVAGGIAAGIMLSLQVISPYDPVTSSKYRKRRSWLHYLALAFESFAMPDTSNSEPTAPPSARPDSAATPIPTQPIVASSKSRLVALLLSTICWGFGIAGIHRFYTGRVISGLFWFFTWGLLGIGQIIDIILIAVGGFRDADGYPVLKWLDNDLSPSTATRHLKAQPVNHHSSIPSDSQLPRGRRLSMGSLLLASLGGLGLAVTLLLGGFVSAEIPKAIGEGVLAPLDPQFHADELEQAFGWEDWPDFVSRIGMILAVLTGLFSLTLLLVSRRGLGVVHMGRVLLSGFAFFWSIMFLNLAFHRVPWDKVAMQAKLDKPLLVVNTITDASGFLPGISFSAIVAVVAVFILAWPAKRHAPTAVPGHVGAQAPRQQHVHAESIEV